MNINTRRYGGIAAILRALAQLALAMTVASEAVAQGAFSWATVGSTGTIDEDSVSIAQLTGPFVTLRTSCIVVVRGGPPTCQVSTGVVTVRYNITRIADRSAYSLTARFRDSGTGKRVELFVKAVDLSSGAENLVFTLDSDTFSSSSSYQTQNPPACPLRLNFDRNAYYIEARITNSGAGLSPGLETISIAACSTLD